MLSYNPAERLELWARFFETDGKKYYHLLMESFDFTRDNFFTISLEDVFEYSRELFESLQTSPDKYIASAEKYVENTLGEMSSFDLKERTQRHKQVVFIDAPKEMEISMNDVRTSKLGRLVTVTGILRWTTPVSLRIVRGCYKCKRCGHEISVKQGIFESESPIFCPKDQGGCGRSASSTRFKLLETVSLKRDTQLGTIEELLEGITTGRQPVQIHCNLDGVMAGLACPGDKVQLIGVVKTHKQKKRDSPIREFYIDCKGLTVLDKQYTEIEISSEDERIFQEMFKSETLMEDLITSFAPWVYGERLLKQSIILQLVGGKPYELKHTRLRGDIHILIVGDPSTVKSQLLLYVSRVAPRGIYASGQPTTGAGLTAAAVKDELTGKWGLEVGALPKADGGIACLDEMDKMNRSTRKVLHDVMAAQLIPINKAGINTVLKARCSILGAANPRSGKFQGSVDNIYDEINLQPSILSRFDLIFILEDVPRSDKDRALHDHMARIRMGADRADEIEGKYSEEIIRKFISYVRNIGINFTQESLDVIGDYYVDMRGKQRNDGKSAYITFRQNDALSRLATAFARLRGSKSVMSADSDAAIDVLNRSYKTLGFENIDSSFIETGRTQSQNEKVKRVISVIEELKHVYPRGVPYSKLEEIFLLDKDVLLPGDLKAVISSLKKSATITEFSKERYVFWGVTG